tara:strand:- start:251 stop:541 length:291 start_codon:yes stop_codon:yes gene_type:complete
MTIELEEVKKLARLSRLDIEESELMALQQDLNSIVGYVHQLEEVNVEGVPCMTHAVPMALRLRTDEAERVLGRAAVEQSAGYDQDEGYVRVPKIVE